MKLRAIAIAAASLCKTEASAQSLMPEGILDALTPDQIRDLFGFLMRK